MGRLYDARPESLPGNGTDHGPSLQLVDGFPATGHTGEARRSDHLTTAGTVGIARRTRHGNQTKVEVTSTHSKASAIAAALSKVNGFLQRIKANAEQLSPRARWRLILSAAFQYFLRGKVLGGTGRLAQATG